MSSPTQRSLAHLRKTCQLVQVVEHWNQFAHIRQDLFGIIDILAIRDGQTIGVQSTSGSNVSARIDKMANSPAIEHLRKAGWVLLVHGWRKVGAAGKRKLWDLREVDIS